jgi:hypothetical protein
MIFQNYPNGPVCPLKEINTTVAEGILEEVRKLDSSREAFKIPVLEAFFPPLRCRISPRCQESYGISEP